MRNAYGGIASGDTVIPTRSPRETLLPPRQVLCVPQLCMSSPPRFVRSTFDHLRLTLLVLWHFPPFLLSSFIPYSSPSFLSSLRLRVSDAMPPLCSRSQQWTTRAHIRHDLPSVHRNGFPVAPLYSEAYCSPFLATVYYTAFSS